jgi:RNase P/RNase MRP subunit p29
MDELVELKNKITGKVKMLTFAHACRMLKDYKGNDIECIGAKFKVKGNQLIKQPKKKKTKSKEKDK